MVTAKFHLPDFLAGQVIYDHVLHWVNTAPDIFLPNTEIHTIFGNFPGCIWNGGTLFAGGSIDAGYIEMLINHYNYDLNMPLTFTFTNPSLELTDYHDTYGNLIAMLGNNGHNIIMIADENLKHYLQDKYPYYTYYRSILTTEKKNYDLTDVEISVMRRSQNNMWDYLDTIPQQDRPRLEFLCNDPCPDNCPVLYKHYKELGLLQRLQGYNPDNKYMGICMYDVNKTEYEWARHDMIVKNHTYISRELIDQEYLPREFQHFKLSGRGNPPRIMAGILFYCIKPEYREDVLVEGMNGMFS